MTGALAIAITNPRKTVIKLDDAGPFTSDTGFMVDADVTIDMRGATLRRNSAGPILTIMDKTVTVLGGTIEGATGTDGNGVLCGGELTMIGTAIAMMAQSGINAGRLCALNLARVKINNTGTEQTGSSAIDGSGISVAISQSWFYSNYGGGITLTAGTFVIVGNVFLNNGSDSNPFGAVRITTSANPSNKLDFNTIASNKSDGGGESAGIDCASGTGTVGHYNIVWNNRPSLTGDQVSGGCKHTYSDIGPKVLPSSLDGGHNLSVDPLLDNEMTDAHLQMASPARGYAETSADLTGLAGRDIDDQPRTPPADIGADQYSAPPGARYTATP